MRSGTHGHPQVHRGCTGLRGRPPTNVEDAELTAIGGISFDQRPACATMSGGSLRGHPISGRKFDGGCRESSLSGVLHIWR